MTAAQSINEGAVAAEPSDVIVLWPETHTVSGTIRITAGLKQKDDTADFTQCVVVFDSHNIGHFQTDESIPRVLIRGVTFKDHPSGIGESVLKLKTPSGMGATYDTNGQSQIVNCCFWSAGGAAQVAARESGGLSAFSAVRHNALADFDADGFSNLREYLSLSDPRDCQDLPEFIADVNGDGDIDGRELALLGQKQTVGDCSAEDHCLDLFPDGMVNEIDLFLFAEGFGRTAADSSGPRLDRYRFDNFPKQTSQILATLFLAYSPTSRSKNLTRWRWLYSLEGCRASR